MPDRNDVLAALATYANEPATSHDIRAEPADTFGGPPFTTLNAFLQMLTSQSELDALLADVAPLVRAADPFRGSAIALNCGSLVEMGGDPDLVFPHLLAELPRHLRLARRAHDRATAPGALFDADPDAARAAAGLMYLLLATMTVICRSAAHRQALRADPEIVDGVFALRDTHREADFVAQVLSLADDLELLVLAPNERKGFRVRLEAIASNAHLFTLLQAALIDGGHLAGEPTDPEVLAVATGAAAPTHALSDHARFNFSPWYSLVSAGSPTESALDGIIAMGVEGHPSEIPPFDGAPVVLIGPTVFASRSWDSNFFANIHDALRSRVDIVEVLSEAEAENWIERIKRQPR